MKHGILITSIIDTCHMAITASVALQLTWRQIQIALETLSNFCNYAPGQISQGGRAFFRPQAVTINDRRRKRQTVVSGNNGLWKCNYAIHIS